MVSAVYMPKLGLIMAKGTIVSWAKKEGDKVAKGEKLAEMATEKTTVEITSPASGTLLKILAPAKSSVPVGQAIAYVGEPGEALPEVAATTTPAAASAAANPTAQAPTAAAISDSAVRATPKARRLAKEKGVDLGLIKGTGPMQMVSEEDVLTYIQETRGKTKFGLKAKEVRELSETRKVIAERMTSSLQTMAQVTLHYEADASELVKLRASLIADIESKTGMRVTYTEMLVKAVARALTEHPIMNSTLEENEIKVVEEINIGVAVASDAGLTVPVIKSADKKSLAEVVSALKAMAEKVRGGKLELEDISGGTFTITNLGTTAVDFFTPIINPPQTAILGVGRIVEKPVAVDGKVEVRPRIGLSLTFDHRVVDGYTAGEFLKRVSQIIESASSLTEALR
jgi:pyruvate dehydrogenase E2 component (dihydrolipoamide acetyltransferase)